MQGWRKFSLGILYVVGVFACVGLAVWRDADAGVIASVAGAAVSVSTGLGVIIWGNVQEHRAKSGNAKPA